MRILNVTAQKPDSTGSGTYLAQLVAGQRVDDVVALLRGNTCGPRSTSCADQMTYALEEARAQS